MKIQNYLVAFFLLALLTLGGCACIEDCCTEKTQTMRAVSQCVKCGNPSCSSHPNEYKRGWIDGFYEVATGDDCCPPSFAPVRYNTPGVILKNCESRHHAYDSGWQDGASRAGQFSDTHYLRVCETCACPFPRCDKPCDDGTCKTRGPCGIGSAGLSVSPDMIESIPMPGAPIHIGGTFLPSGMIDLQEDAHVDSSSNRDVPVGGGMIENLKVDVLPTLEADRKWSPKKREAKTSEKAQPDNKNSVPTPAPPKLDAKTTDSVDFNSPSAFDTSNVFEATPREQFQSSGFVRLAKSTQPDASGTRSRQDSSDNHVIVVESVRHQFEMLETEPVVKLVQ